MFRVNIVGLFLLLCYQTRYVDGGSCFDSGGNFFTFGATCTDYKCNCKVENEKCDGTTGKCPSGCAPGWFGPGCQFKNVAQGAFVDSNNNRNTDWATDGDLTRCSVGDATSSPFIRVNTEEAFITSEIIVHFKNLSAVSGFTVYAGTSLNRDQSTLCNRDLGTSSLVTTGNITGNISVVCTRPRLASIITIILPGPGRILEICEIQVPVGRVVSFKKPAFASQAEAGNAAEANNGHTRQIYASIETTSPFWYVDLGRMFTINMIEIANRDDLPQFIIGFQIHISNRSDFSEAELIYADTSTQTSVKLLFRIAVNTMVARFVRVSVPGDRKRLHVKEISVLGGCADNLCGLDCNTLCYCAERLIPMNNQVTGRCPGLCDRNVRNIDGYCNTSICQGNAYGYQCKYDCQCTDSCNVWSGVCMSSTTSCRRGFYGENCQARNTVAGSSSAMQGSGSDYYAAAITVDGSVDTCSPQLSGTASSWFIQLTSTQAVDQVLIYVKDNTTGSGIDVAIENGQTSSMCTVDRLGSQSRFLGRCKNQPATLVRITPRSSMQICEVAVLACSDGTYGPLCEKACMCAGEAACDPYTGICPVGGCESGYQGRNCSEECRNGFYGNSCTSQCGKCNGGSTCDIFTGECQKPCQPGWMGGRCDVECANGTYDADCLEQCGYCYNGEPCNKETGVCPGGCDKGYFEGNCKTVCAKGRFGYNCNETCGGCNNGEFCMPIDGKCASGCVVGKVPPTCVEDCPHGYFGQNCTKLCGSCRNNNTCNSTTGICEDGCADGVVVLREHPMCTDECPFGRYGYNCSESCRGDTCAGSYTCNAVTGACLAGCLHPGFIAPDCSKECWDGMYGLDCGVKCGFCKNRTACNKTTGHCPAGCESGYAGPICLDEDPQLAAVSIVLLVFGCVLAVAGLIGIAIGFWIYKKGIPPWVSFQRRKKDDKVKDEKAPRSISIVSRVYENNISSESEPEKLKRTNSNASNYKLSMTKPKGTISLDALWDYVQDKKLSTPELTQQFKDLPVGLIHPCEAAKKAQNLRKNRYKEIFAYDHSRVKLDALPGDATANDYVNACYISGYNRPHMYIAAQGPTEEFVCDFWRMIWEKQCRKVVMLTRLVEHNKVKCCQYWPDDGIKQYGTLFVEFKEADRYADFTIRTFSIYMEGKETREVKQFHFESWADRHVPEYASSLVHFWTTVRTTDLKDNVPILVHCSAGIGRTGTFLALDYLVEQANAEGYVNVFQCIQNLRHQRVNMVQNQDQYVFLHEALVEALFCPSSATPCDMFYSNYKKNLNVDPKTHKCSLEQEFEKLQYITKFHDSQKSNFYDNNEYKAANNSANKEKNRSSHILPSDMYRPCLITRVQDRNDYINAVYLPSHREDKMFLLTQNPLPDTIVDFWRMVYENKVSTIVNLDHIKIPSEVYWPREEETLTFIPFTLHNIGEVDQVSFIERSIRLQNAEEPHEKARIIKLYECRFWMSEDRVPVGGESSFLALYEHVQKWQQISGNQPVVVHCLNGATKSGLFCVVMSTLERLRQERDVALQQTIKQMRIRRHQIVPTFEQYKFCHDILLEHMKGVDGISDLYI